MAPKKTEEVVKPKAKPKAAKGKPKPKEAPASGSKRRHEQGDDAQTAVTRHGDPQTAAPVHPCEAETIPDPSLGCSFVCAAASDPTTQATHGVRNELSYTTP